VNRQSHPFPVLLGSLFLVVLLGCSERADRFHSQALAQAEAGKYTQAETTLHRLIGLEPERVRGHLALAAIHRTRNEFDQAINELTKTMALAETDPRPAYALGCLYQEMSKPLLAEESFREALKRDPQHQPSIYRLGLLKARQGERETAIRIYRALLELGPERPAAVRSNLGVALWLEDEREAALEEFAQARTQEPETDAILFNFGVSALRAGREESEGIRALRKYLEVEPPPPDRALVLKILRRKGVGDFREPEYVSPQEALEKGMVLEGKGDLEGALACYRQALELDPRNIQAHYRLGILYDDRLGDRRGAIEAYEAFLDLHRNPKSDLVAEVVKRLGRARRELGAAGMAGGKIPVRTVATPRASVAPTATPPRDAAALLADARRHERGGRLAEALESYRRAGQLAPNSAAAALGEGRVHLAMGRYGPARAALEQACAREETQEARELLREAYLKLEEAAVADEDFRAAAIFAGKAGKDSVAREHELEAGRRDYRLALKENRRPAALKALRELTAARPQEAEAWLALGDLLYRSDPFSSEGRSAYRAFLKADPRHPRSEKIRGRLSRMQAPPAATPSPAPRADPRSLYNQGASLQREGRLKEAEGKYLAALQAEPELYQAAYNLGVLCNAQGRYRDALGFYKQVVELNPDFAPAHLALFKLYYYRFKMAGPARAHARTYLKLEPATPEAEKLRRWLSP